jgi:hypothetical protein
MWLDRIRNCLLVIPGEPAFRVLKQLRRVLLKSRQVMEGVDSVESTSVDETHKQITDVSSMWGFIEQRVLAMQNCLFERLLAERMPIA